MARSRLPSRSFPQGSSLSGESTAPPAALVIFAGHIQETKERVNSMTNRPFRWVSVRTVAGVFDVVADPELVAAPIAVGGVLAGSFWLSGRIKGRETAGSRRVLRKRLGRQ